MNKPLEPSKVIHTRIPVITLAGVIDALEFVAERDVQGRKLSSMVATALEGFINTMVRRELLNKYTLEEAYERLAPWLGEPAAVDFGIDVSISLIGDDAPPVDHIAYAPDEEEEEHPEAHIKVDPLAVSEALARAHVDPFAHSEVTENENVVIPPLQRVTVTRNQLRTAARLHIQEIANATQDEPIEIVQEAMQTANSDMILAIETVFTSLKPTMWRKSIATNTIYQVMEDLAGEK